MPLKPSQEKKKNSSSVKKNIADILVANHVHEPYILAFRYSGENIASESLGTIFGFFEIEVHDQDAAYIVNFLASVAKKEFFANIRRGPVESFEAALHKINVALSELVKHGNITWLGHLNGAIAVLVENKLHFSVTGEASLFLWRDGTLRSISEGLAEKEDEPHPLKTFVEIAGGDLMVGDRVFLFSNSVWSLFTPNDLEKSIRRFSPVALEQFLRTALVNELDSAALILIACEEEERRTPVARKEEASSEKEELPNAFSATPFHEKAKKVPQKEEVVMKERDAEFVDTKTGHIYVQGENFEGEEGSPWKERVDVFKEKINVSWDRFRQKTNRSSRKWRKEALLSSRSVGIRAADMTRSLGRKMRSIKRKRAEESSEQVTLAIPQFPEAASQTLIDTPHLAFPSSSQEDPGSSPSREKILQRTSEMALFVRNLSRQSFSFLQNFWSGLILSIKSGASSLLSSWRKLSLRNQMILGSVFLFILLLLIFFLFHTSTPSPVATTQAPSPKIETPPLTTSATLSGSTTLPLAGEEAVLSFPSGEHLKTLVFLNNTPWAVTESALYNLSNNERVSAPETIALATEMNDLQSIFFWSESGKLFSFTPSNKKITENTFPLPKDASVSGLSSYLTYLYALDATHGKIYRFPRVEGGFGEAVSWLKDGATFDPGAVIAVNDIVVVGGGNHVTSFAKGKTDVSYFEMPEPASNLTHILVLPDTNDVYSFDANEKRIIKWGSDGKLKKRWSIASLSNVSHIGVSLDQKTLLVGSDEKVLRFNLQ